MDPKSANGRADNDSESDNISEIADLGHRWRTSNPTERQPSELATRWRTLNQLELEMEMVTSDLQPNWTDWAPTQLELELVKHQLNVNQMACYQMANFEPTGTGNGRTPIQLELVTTDLQPNWTDWAPTQLELEMTKHQPDGEQVSTKWLNWTTKSQLPKCLVHKFRNHKLRIDNFNWLILQRFTLTVNVSINNFSELTFHYDALSFIQANTVQRCTSTDSWRDNCS